MRTTHLFPGLALAAMLAAPAASHAQPREWREPDRTYYERDLYRDDFRRERAWPRQRAAQFARQLSVEARQLERELRRVPGQGELAREARELARAADRFAALVARDPRRATAVRAFLPLEARYQRLRAGLIATSLRLRGSVYRQWDEAVVQFEYLVLALGEPAVARPVAERLQFR